ncbi:hypothetical protein E5288_WYG014890 [Bos mutus]|uniref:Uncharacterized protein n=1 Tax=Bos mutus TaxID=72004 RepID=A0A6B0S5T1_9CETA|nr:hypothetical protein [Bos mutus]
MGPGTLIQNQAGDPRPDPGLGTLVQNRAGDPCPDPGPGTLAQIWGRGPSSRTRLGTLAQIRGWTPSSRIGAGDPHPELGWGPSSRSGAGDPRPDMGPGTLIQNQAGDPRPDPGLDTLIQNRGRGPSSRTGLGTLVQIRGRVPSPRSGAGDPRPDPGWAPSSRSRLGTLLQIQAKDSPLGRWSLMPGGSASRPGLPFCSARTVSRLTSRSSLALRYFQFAQTKHTCPNQLCKKEGIESHLKLPSKQLYWKIPTLPWMNQEEKQSVHTKTSPVQQGGQRLRGPASGTRLQLQRQLELGDVWTASASGVDSGGAARGP